MKLIALLTGLLFGPAILADTITQLPFVPPPTSLAAFHQEQSRCAATGFTAQRIAGVCQYAYGTSSKYFALPTVLYYVSWDQETLTPSLGKQCAYTTPQRQYVGDGCDVNFNPTKTTMTIDGVPYYYVSTSSLGDPLVSSNAASFVVEP
jgi:hypothetical protein